LDDRYPTARGRPKRDSAVDHAISESIDEQFELEELAHDHEGRVRALKLRQAAELTEEKRVLAALRKRRKEYAAELQRLEADRSRARVLQEEATAAIVGVKTDCDAVILHLRQSHEREVSQLRLRQQGEVEQLIGEIEVVKGERQKKATSERQKYRAALQRLAGDGQVVPDDDIGANSERTERTLAQVKAAYERVIAVEQL
jgi:hypothetical protein